MGKKREKNFSKFQKKSNSSTKNDTGTNLTSNPGVTDASNSPKSKKFFSKKSDSKKGSDHDEQTNFFTEKSSNVDTMKEWSNQEDKLDERFGFSRITEIFGEAKLGFLVNIQPVD